MQLEGRSFGRWTSIERSGRRGYNILWRCRCVCGTVKDVVQSNLVSGTSKSCGCRKHDVGVKHGAARRGSVWPEFYVWKAMIDRCHNKNSQGFARYGGRGIRVCDEWRQDFSAFISDLGRRPSVNHTIERVDNSLGYFAGNCKWATHIEQDRNKRTSRKVAFNGRSLTVAEWSEVTGISDRTLIWRLNAGWPPDSALTVKVNIGNKSLGLYRRNPNASTP